MDNTGRTGDTVHRSKKNHSDYSSIPLYWKGEIPDDLFSLSYHHILPRIFEPYLMLDLSLYCLSKKGDTKSYPLGKSLEL
jgi:hypothetical protein